MKIGVAHPGSAARRHPPSHSGGHDAGVVWFPRHSPSLTQRDMASLTTANLTSKSAWKGMCTKQRCPWYLAKSASSAARAPAQSCRRVVEVPGLFCAYAPVWVGGWGGVRGVSGVPWWYRTLGGVLGRTFAF
eukprot:3933276-Rhodomonas_salina.2